MNIAINIRPMLGSDLARVMEIQALCYLGLPPESLSCYQAKLKASAKTCFVAELEQEIVAYLIALPWHESSPPMFNEQTCELPSVPSSLYLHDLAVIPQARKHRVGAQLVDCFFELASNSRFEQACLVAVDGAHTYWQRFDFTAVQAGPQAEKALATYGDQAMFMKKRLV